ncbi:MFS transporter [Streptomyces sp. NPDC046876]|uniref:MFS transporter n=1 Tax=Streptomyces sp. NPDC046876 TaxID=3155616 RepID=UPI00340E8C0F
MSVQTSAAAAAPAVENRLTAKDVLAIAGMFLGVFSIGADSFIISPILRPISEALDSSLATAGLGVTAYAICYAVGAPLLGPLADRISRKRMLLTGMALFVVATVLSAFVWDVLTFCITRGLAGIGAAMVTPNVMALIATTYRPPLLPKIIGIVMSALSLAIVVGVPIGSYLAEAAGWRSSFYFIAGLGLLSGLVLSSVLADNPPAAGGAKKSYLGAYAEVLRSRTAVFALLTTLTWMTGFYGVYTYLGTYLGDSLAISTATVGSLLLAYGAGNFAASFMAGWVVAKLGPRSTVMVNGLVSSVVVIALASADLDTWAVLLLLIGWAFTQGFAITAMTAVTAGSVPEARATVMSMNSSCIYLGLTLGSAIFGALFTRTSFTWVGVAAAAATLLAIVANVVATKPAKAAAGA